ncbi:MAG: alpha/beta fold hydrolase [Verrucomicrobiota bacterium]
MLRKLLKIVGLVLFGLCLVCWLAVNHIASQIVSPPRRALLDYHHEWLKNPADHSIQIESYTLLNGMVPCLVVTPDGNPRLSKRANTVRSQLAKMGYTLGPLGEVKGSVVLLHGRKGRKEDLLPIAERFCAVGLRCILPDLPAHGESRIETVHFGSGDGEADLATRILLETAKRGGFSPHPSAIWGMSMGGAFAASSLSASSSKWDCAIIVSSFDDLDEVIRQKSYSKAGVLGLLFSKMLQHSLQSRHGLDPTLVRPADWLRASTAPLLVAHGTADPLFPIARGRVLFDASSSLEKKWVEVEGGNHHNVLVTEMPLYATMAAWIIDHLPKSSRS